MIRRLLCASLLGIAASASAAEYTGKVHIENGRAILAEDNGMNLVLKGTDVTSLSQYRGQCVRVNGTFVEPRNEHQSAMLYADTIRVHPCKADRQDAEDSPAIPPL